MELNRAASIAMAEGPEAGLALIERLASGGELERYHLLHAAQADLLRCAGRLAEARAAYQRAHTLCGNEVERGYL